MKLFFPRVSATCDVLVLHKKTLTSCIENTFYNSWPENWLSFVASQFGEKEASFEDKYPPSRKYCLNTWSSWYKSWICLYYKNGPTYLNIEQIFFAFVFWIIRLFVGKPSSILVWAFSTMCGYGFHTALGFGVILHKITAIGVTTQAEVNQRAESVNQEIDCNQHFYHYPGCIEKRLN